MTTPKHSIIKRLEREANLVRQDIIRMLEASGSGHSAGSLGMADVLVALYFQFLRINPRMPISPRRDYLVLSNGHICPALYAVLAHRGFFPRKKLLTLRKLGSALQGHPHRTELPGLETSSGPLGSGLGQAAGMALALRMDKKKNRVVCLTSDGEHDEGNHWEAVLFAAKYKLDNLIQVIDRNKIQIDGTTEEVMPLFPLKEKYRAFHWHVLEINGHDIAQILDALDQATQLKGQPVVIIAHTTPGKGVPFMQNDPAWHGRAPNHEEAEQAIKALQEGPV